MGRNQQGEGAEKRCVQHDLDTLITARYVEVDDLFIGLGVRQGPGRPSRLTDAELVCLAVAQVLLDSTPVPCGASRETVKGSPGSPSGPVSGHPIGASSDGDPSMGCPPRPPLSQRPR